MALEGLVICTSVWLWSCVANHKCGHMVGAILNVQKPFFWLKGDEFLCLDITDQLILLVTSNFINIATTMHPVNRRKANASSLCPNCHHLQRLKSPICTHHSVQKRCQSIFRQNRTLNEPLHHMNKWWLNVPHSPPIHLMYFSCYVFSATADMVRWLYEAGDYHLNNNSSSQDSLVRFSYTASRKLEERSTQYRIYRALALILV